METEEKSGSVAAQISKFAAVFVLKTLAWIVVIGIPALGVWAGSSLAVYGDGPLWAAILAGLCAFPLLPLAWEASSAWRRGRREEQTKRALTFGDRLIIRTFALNFVFLALFLFFWPVPIFEALASRGDWMLQGRTDPTSELLRRALLRTADRMSWLYDAATENEYATDEDPPLPTPEPTPMEDEAPRVDPVPAQPDEASEEAHRRIARTRGRGPPRWPFPNEVHPLVREIPREQEGSVEAVARYLSEREPDPYLRIKALHDYVADRVVYDVASLTPGNRAPQDAGTVFSSRRGVCEGYARLLVAMGEAANERIVYLVGNARDEEDQISGIGHAWNAVQIENRWYLIDATWDAGNVNGDQFEKHYKSDYFLTPPDMFSLDHLPEEEDWQLRQEPLSRGEFVRQPRLKPSFFRAGLRLVSPDRSHVTVADRFVAQIENAAGHFAMANIRPHRSGAQGDRCDVRNGAMIEVRCRVPSSGVWDVIVFESPEQYATYWDVASFQVVSSP